MSRLNLPRITLLLPHAAPGTLLALINGGKKGEWEGVMEKMMDVMQIQSFGGPEVLRFQKIPVPQPGAREILVKVRAASVNPVDYKIRLGKYPGVKEEQLPYVLGRDFAGEVEMLGEGVSAVD